MRDELGGDIPDFKPMKAGMTREAMSQYQSYMKAVFYDLIDDGLDERLHGNYRRMHIQMLKIALALAVMDWSQGGGAESITITLGHVALAQEMAEIARAGLHRLMPVLSESADSRTQRDLLSLLKHHPAGLTFREVCKLNGRATKELRSALNVLMDSGLVEVVEHKPPTGRPTNIYRLLTDK
jgi:predicted transcriptional regulator